MRTRIPIVTVLVACAIILGAWALAKPLLWVVDILTGRERIVAKQQLPNGGRIEIFQYWNDDFYNLSLRNITEDGTQYECVIDPDCFRITSCKIEVDATRAEATITAKTDSIWARYRWEPKQLLRKNGPLIQADIVR